MSKKLTAVRQINKLAAEDDITFLDQAEETCSNTEIDNNVSFNQTSEPQSTEPHIDQLIVARQIKLNFKPDQKQNHPLTSKIESLDLKRERILAKQKEKKALCF